MKLVEKMARADAEFCGKTFDAMSNADKRRYMERAAFMLGAAREPTEEMVDAMSETGAEVREACRVENRRLNRQHPEATADCEWMPQAFTAAIDTAIQEAEAK
jgi:hypothetical protein